MSRMIRRATAVSLLVLLAAANVAAAQEPTEPPSPTAPAVATPNTDRPLTREELLRVRGEMRDRSYRMTTLVADTVVVRDVPVRSIEEPRPYRQGIGVLPRDERYPGAPVVQASRQVRALPPQDDTPIEGRLAFDIDVEGIQLLGTVSSPSGTYVTPIEPAALAAADALPAGALIIARGWLSSLGSRATCPELPRELDPHDSGGWGDPFVRCPAGWLTAGPVTETDPSDPLAPAMPGVPVQWGARERFTRDMDSQGALTFLLRHVANPVEGAEPALGWEVIGRLDPVEPGVPGTVPLAEAARPGGLDWRPVVERQPPADTRSMSSTAWAGGFASVHTGQDRVLSSWVSVDGQAWQHASLPVGITWVSALLPLGDGLAIIADEDRFDQDAWTFEVWTSNDGLRWRQASRQRIRAPERFAGYRRIVHGYWPTDRGIVALETYTQQPCCGFGPGAMSFVAAEEREPDVTYTWTSSDGRRWTRQRASGVHGYPGQHLGSSISAADGELLAIWPERSRRIGRSTDGVRWRTVGRYPAQLDTYAPFGLTRTPDGFVLAGEPSDSEIGTGNTLTIWRRSGEEPWVRTLEPRQGTPWSIASMGDSVIVAGERLDPEELQADDPSRLSWLLVSADGGATWDDTLSWSGDDPWCLGDLAERDGTVLLDGGCAPPDAASTYVMTP